MRYHPSCPCSSTPMCESFSLVSLPSFYYFYQSSCISWPGHSSLSLTLPTQRSIRTSHLLAHDNNINDRDKQFPLIIKSVSCRSSPWSSWCVRSFRSRLSSSASFPYHCPTFLPLPLFQLYQSHLPISSRSHTGVRAIIAHPIVHGQSPTAPPRLYPPSWFMTNLA